MNFRLRTPETERRDGGATVEVMGWVRSRPRSSRRARATNKERARKFSAPSLLEPTAKTSSYCTVSVNAAVVFWVGPSVAVTVMLYGAPAMAVGMVAGVSISVPKPDLVESAWDVAVMVTFPGRPAAIVGAVYRPVELIEPPLLAGVTVQVTAVLLVFVTVAVNCVC